LLKQLVNSLRKHVIWKLTSRWETQREFGVNLSGYLSSQFGVGTSSRAFAEALKQANVPLALNNRVSPHHEGHRSVFDNSFSDTNPYRINIIHYNADVAKYFFEELGPSYFHSRFNVGIWYWELANFPKQWYNRFKYLNELWVVSQFIAESLSKVSPIPIVKVRYPLSVPPNIPPLDARRRYGLKEEFILLFVFDFNSYFERKNLNGLLRAYTNAFNNRIDVLLILNSINGGRHPNESSALREMLQNTSVRHIEGPLSELDYYALFAAANCYVSLHRSEGFGVPMAEAMCLGKPVIATGYSGNMEYMNANNSLPVKFKIVKLEENYGPYEKGNIWAEPDIEHATELLKWVHENQDEAETIGKQARIDVKKTLNQALAGQEMKRRLETISAKMERQEK